MGPIARVRPIGTADAMTILTLLLAVLLAAFIFAATLFSASQVYFSWNRRWIRLTHALSVFATLVGMAALHFGSGALSVVAGLPLLASSSAAFFLEKRWNRVLPPFQAGFAAVLLMYPALVVE